jgi:hypothetical protein
MTVKASNRETKRNVASDSERKGANLSCKACGHAFVTFLEEMAEHNAKQMGSLSPRKRGKVALKLLAQSAAKPTTTVETFDALIFHPGDSRHAVWLQPAAIEACLRPLQ